MIFFSFVFALILRLYKLRENLFFEGELGHNYLAIKNIVVSHSIPLLGPPTSHEWLSFGPLYYWLFTPLMMLGNFNPLVGALVFALIGAALPLLHYTYVRRIVSDKVAFLSSLLIVTSPFMLLITRQSRFFSLVIPLMYIFLLLLFDALKKNPTKLIWASLVFGIMLNFHLSPIVMIPPIALVLYRNKKKFHRSILFKSLGAFMIPHIPFFLADKQTGFTMTKNIVLWLPYRVAGFAGLYPKNNVSTSSALETSQAIWKFISETLLPWPSLLGGLLILFICWRIFQERKKMMDANILFIGGLIGIFIHGNPPYHYFFPLVPFVFIYATRAMSRRAYLVIFICALNLITFSQRLEIQNVIPYPIQDAVVQSIISDADKKPFVLKRVGKDDNFEGDFAQNYRYLLWYHGNEPQDKAATTYTIYENTPTHIATNEAVIKKIDTITITKK